MNKIVLAGGNGYLGSVLADYFKNKVKEIVILSRRRSNNIDNIRIVYWDGKNKGAWTKELEDADLLINLAGKSVNCRYTEANKKEIYDSRLNSTQVLGNAVQDCQHPPRIWINSSSATIYNASFEKDMTESGGETGDDFSMNVCKKWEATFDSFKTPFTRKIVMRTSIVLGKNGGAFPTLMNLVKVRLGGKQGNGKQYVSWLHENDFCRIIEWFAATESAQGIYNVVSPGAITNSKFMEYLRYALNISWGLPASKLLLQLGAVLIGTETELILKSRKVYPQRLLNDGFVFEFSDAKEALEHLCRSEERRN